MAKENILRTKGMNFAVRVVKLFKFLQEEKKEFVLSKQILRSGTSIGANIAESENAISNKEFLAKVYIALKECSETIYWLDLLYRTDYLDRNQYESMTNDCVELRKIMMATTKTLTAKLKNKAEC